MHGLVARVLASAPVYNLSHPLVLAHWGAALLSIAGVVWVAWNAGRAVVGAWPGRSASDSFVIYTATGLAVAACALSILALTGAYALGPVLALAVVGLASPALLERSPRAGFAFWGNLRETVREEPWGWALMLACSIGALIPPFRWDEISYHLAYPQQWVSAGRVTVDPYMTYPLYTFNWHVLLGAALMVHSEALAHLLSWFAAVLTALTVRLMLDRLAVPPAIGRVAFFAVALTPLIERYATLAMVDVPLMAFLTVTTYALFALRDVEVPTPRLALPAALSAGMFIGMKVTNLLYAPLFLALALFRLQGRARWVYLAVCLAFGSIWFARNYALSGDPANPLMSRVLHRPARYWSEGDLQAQTQALRSTLSYAPADLARLPIRLLTSTETGPLKDRPLLGYALLMPLSLLLLPSLWRRHALDPLVTLWYSVGVWLVTAYQIRYAVWAPLAVVCAALVIHRGLEVLWTRRPKPADWIVAGLLLVGPTPAAFATVRLAFDEKIDDSPREHLARAMECGPGDCWFTAFTRLATAPAGVYALTAPGVYYYQEAGFHVVSNPFHAGRWSDFIRNADAGRLPAYLSELGAQYVTLSAVQAAQIYSRPADSVLATISHQLPPPIYHDGEITIFRAAEH